MIVDELFKPCTEEEKEAFFAKYNDERYILDESEGSYTASIITEEEAKTAEQLHIDFLNINKRDLAVILRDYFGYSYDRIKELISSDNDLLLEWELSGSFERRDSSINRIGELFGISSEKLDAIFAYKAGEISEEDFLATINN